MATPISLVVGCKHFRGIFCLHLQGRNSRRPHRAIENRSINFQFRAMAPLGKGDGVGGTGIAAVLGGRVQETPK